MKDLIYKIGGRHEYCTNSWKVDTNPIGVEFLMNGKLYLSKDKIPKFRENKEYITNPNIQSVYNIEIIEDFHKYFFYRVNEYMDEDQPGYGWEIGEDGKKFRNAWRETDIIIYPTKSDIGYTEDNPIIKSNSGECQTFRNKMYGKYSYGFYWNETQSGINLSEYKSIIYIGDDYYDLYTGENKYWDGVRKHSGVFDPLVRHSFEFYGMISNRKSAIRELRFSKILENKV